MSVWVAMLLAAAPAKAAGPFEGVLTYALEAQGGKGTVSIAVAPAGVRSEAVLFFNDTPSRTTVLVTQRDPAVSYVWDDKQRTFTPRTPGAGSVTVSKTEVLDAEKVAGVACRHVRLTTSLGVVDYWTAPGFLGDRAREGLVASAQRVPAALQEALKKEKAWGLVLRMTNQSPDGRVTTSMELTSFKRVPVDRSLFDPAARPK